jgi:hypothetical protein
LLSVAGNESAGTLTVRAAWSSSGETASGTAAVTIATIEAEIPSNLTVVLSPDKTGLELSWYTVKNAASYKVYRSTNGIYYSYLADTAFASYRDTSVTAGSSCYYAVSAVVNGQETQKSAAAFGFVTPHFRLPAHSDSYPINLPAGSKHYYRLAVSAGQSYTITWQDGNGKDAGYYIQCTAWQNDGTAIFTNVSSGYTSPKIFTAAAAGYVTVEVRNTSSSTSYDYQIYY